MNYLLRLGLFLALFAVALPAMAQRHTLSGSIADAEDGEVLMGVTIWVDQLRSGTTSNRYGYYSLTLPEGTYEVTYSFIGYQSITRTVELTDNVVIDMDMAFEQTQLDEVVITDVAEDVNVKSTAMSVNTISIEQVKQLPALFGEPDLIKTVQMQPGVISAGEGTSAFFVRGGSADQNLILIDEAPIYDPSHLFGLFSVFNADVLRNSTLYKGGIPSQFGGRLSSILDVHTKDGNLKEFGGSAGLGLLASKLMLEGPIVKDEASFLISGRRSYVDIFFPLFNNVEEGTEAYFYDINAKLSWRPNENNRHFLAFYSGRDAFGTSDFGFSWGNQTLTYRWNHIFNPKLFSNTTLIGSQFDYRLEIRDPLDGLDWTSSIQELSLKQDFEWYANPNNEVYFGYHGGYRRYQPGNIRSTGSQGNFNSLELQSLYGLDHALYVGNRQTVTDRLALEYGLRLGLFQSIGDGDFKIYEDQQNRDDPVVLETRSYDDFEVIKNFWNWQPRASARYELTNTSSVKASYQRMVQNAHVISSGTVPLPFNTWEPSGLYLDPQLSDQVAAGYFRNLRNNTYEFSAEVYYKHSNNITEFADNAQLFFNTDLATEFRQGEAESYGLELYLRKKKGRLQGFASYTLSRTWYDIPSVNNGERYVANFDRPHSFNVSATYEITDKYTFGASFVYGSGRPITLPTGTYLVNGEYWADFITERNAYRMPDFHRLDFSVNKYIEKKLFNYFEQSWNVSVYNAYSRKNPFTVYTRTAQDEDGNIIGDGSLKELRLVYLFPILPSFTYSLKF